MSAPVRIQSRERGVWFDELPEKLSQAVDEYDLSNTTDWQPLEELSGGTIFEGVEAYGDSAIIDGNQLVAPGTVYVTLQYDPNSDEPVKFHDSYPARIFFAVSNDTKDIQVQRIDIDTTSFYET